MDAFYLLQPYKVPEWAQSLQNQPKYKVKVFYYYFFLSTFDSLVTDSAVEVGEGWGLMIVSRAADKMAF